MFLLGVLNVLIKSILVAVDDSENSDRALDFALDLGEKYNAAVTVLNVSEFPAMGVVPQEPTAYSGGSMAVFSKDLRKFHEEILSKAVVRAKAIKPDLAISSKLREGEPASEIVDAAKEGSFDVIVVGHKGVSRVRELFLGSVSEKVAHLAPCPVIIVK
jgi:nucleotide-binding universal stress UspA family protein